MKYTCIEQIFKDGERLIDDFSDADLSSLDLSAISPEMWKGAKFYNTNFSGTNIKFYPRDLKTEFFNSGLHFSDDYFYHDIRKCNFSNCILLPWELCDLNDAEVLLMSDTDFSGSNLSVDFSQINGTFTRNLSKAGNLINCILPSYYSEKPREYWDKIKINLNTVQKSNLHVSSGKLLELISGLFHSSVILTEKEWQERNKKILELIDHDEEGYLKKLYYQLKPYFKSVHDEQLFFSGIIRNTNFDEMDLSYITPKMWESLKFENCNFSFLKLGYSYHEITKESTSKKQGILKGSNVERLSIPVTIKNWNNHGYGRLGRSSITYQTNLYLELDRICNMGCTFCRNQGLDHSTSYNYDKIIENLKVIYPHIDHIVVGGGEPTLLLDDLKRLRTGIEDISLFASPLQVITNGSLDVETLLSEMPEYAYDFIISRHAVSDKENALIFGTNQDILYSEKELTKIVKERHKATLCCTCFDGGVDSKEKMIEYLRFAQDLGFKSILFQTLHQEERFNIQEDKFPKTIHESVMKDTLDYLFKIGFTISDPIYSTSGYELHIAKFEYEDSVLKVTFKEYKDPIEIEKKWNLSPKRCFDLSMDPSGNLYETWDQQKAPVKIKK